MSNQIYIPDLGFVDANSLISKNQCVDSHYSVGKNGVEGIYTTKDKKSDFIVYNDRTMVYVDSALGYPALYRLLPTSPQKPVKAVLMDLDGTSVKSEEFWIWIIQCSVASLLGNPKFELEQSDLPFVSGHSVSEHLSYCIKKYCPDKSLDDARNFYFEHTHREMAEILSGGGRKNAFVPTQGLKEFLLELKSRNIKIGLVTSGLYEKAYPEILSAFSTLDMGDPKEFYDCIITAGYPLRKGSVGTLGELSPKPHPWLYAEAGCVGLGIPFDERNQVIGIEDSGAGVCSLKLAGYPTIGIDGGNIEKSGTKFLCNGFVSSFDEVLRDHIN